MKIEVYYIHFSYLSQCIIFKQPSKLVKHKLPCKIHVGNTTKLSSAFILLPIFHNCLCNQYQTHRAIVSWLACLLSSLIHDSFLIQKHFMDVIPYIHMHSFFSLIDFSNYEPLKKTIIFLFFYKALAYHMYVFRISNQNCIIL